MIVQALFAEVEGKRPGLELFRRLFVIIMIVYHRQMTWDFQRRLRPGRRFLAAGLALSALWGAPALAASSSSSPPTAKAKRAVPSKKAAAKILKKALKNELKARAYERKARQTGFLHPIKDLIYQMKADRYHKKAKKDFNRAAEIESRGGGDQPSRKTTPS